MSRIVVSPAIALVSPADTTVRVINEGKKTTLVVSSTRGTHYKDVTGLYFSEIGRDQLLTALLEWRYVIDELPDDETRVMLAIGVDTDEPIFGVHADENWWTDEGAVIADVYAWAHIPGLPPKKGGAS